MPKVARVVLLSRPQHLVAFGFKHLWRDPEAETDPRARKALPLLWPPRRIATELSDEALRTLQDRLEVGLFETFELSPSRLASHVRELRQWMSQPVADVVEQVRTRTGRQPQAWADAFARNVVEHENEEPPDDRLAETLVKWQVGETCFRQYYTGDPATKIGEWCYSVWRRVREAILDQGEGDLFVLLLQSERDKPPLQPAETSPEEGDAKCPHTED